MHLQSRPAPTEAPSPLCWAPTLSKCQIPYLMALSPIPSGWISVSRGRWVLVHFLLTLRSNSEVMFSSFSDGQICFLLLQGTFSLIIEAVHADSKEDLTTGMWSHNRKRMLIWTFLNCITENHLLHRKPRAHHQYHDHTAALDCGRGLVSGPAQRGSNRAQVLLPLCVWWALLWRGMLCVLPAQRWCIRSFHLRRTWRNHLRCRVEGPVLYRMWVKILNINIVNIALNSVNVMLLVWKTQPRFEKIACNLFRKEREKKQGKKQS